MPPVSPCFESIVGVGWPMAFSSVTSLFTKSIDLWPFVRNLKSAGNLRDNSHRAISSAPSDVESLFAPLEPPHTSSYIVRIAFGPRFVGSIFDIVNRRAVTTDPVRKVVLRPFGTLSFDESSSAAIGRAPRWAWGASIAFNDRGWPHLPALMRKVVLRVEQEGPSLGDGTLAGREPPAGHGVLRSDPMRHWIRDRRGQPSPLRLRVSAVNLPARLRWTWGRSLTFGYAPLMRNFVFTSGGFRWASAACPYDGPGPVILRPPVQGPSFHFSRNPGGNPFSKQ